MTNQTIQAQGTSAESSRLPWTTYLLTLCQAINLTAAVISVTIAALVGAKLAPSAALATVPYGAQFAAVMVCTYPAAMLMRVIGRRAGFAVGAVSLMISGAIGYQAVRSDSFELLIVAHAFLGGYVSCANYYRFAAVDRLTGELRSKGISWVVAGGVLAALAGPLIAINLRSVEGYPEFSLCYAALIALGLLTMVLLSFWRVPAAPLAPTTAASEARVQWTWPIAAAVFASAGGYLLMNLLMVQSSLMMREMHVHFNQSSHAIQAHVLAMFAPSFVTGLVIAKVGYRKALTAGFGLLIATSVIGVSLVSYEAIFAGLILLGLGWNITYVGGGALLTQYLTEETRHRWQGINDSLIAVCATIGALSPAILQATIGWKGSNALGLVLCLAGVVICLVGLKPQNASATVPMEKKA
jgi:predicted MFS family arabinose efflux permease